MTIGERVYRMALPLGAALGLMSACDSGDGGEPAGDPIPPGVLEVVEPGGDTTCSRGTPYRFAAIGGDPRRLVIDFQGGGACWDELTCSVAGSIFSEEAPSREAFEAFASPEGGLSGQYERDNPNNPVADWTLVHISYCSGDIHFGDATHEYKADLTIEHRGYRNVMAVLDWTQARYPSLDAIHVTGCSAGAYGAIGYTSEVRRRWPDARITVLADSGAGIVTDQFASEAFDTWNVWNAVDVNTLEALYIETARAHPDIRIGQFSSAYDVRQRFYYNVMGGGADWTERLLASYSAIAADAPSFRSYVAPGPAHCILGFQSYYSRDAGPGTMPFSQWLETLIEGDALPPSVACEGEACLQDSVCEACAEGVEWPECGFCSDWP